MKTIWGALAVNTGIVFTTRTFGPKVGSFVSSPNRMDADDDRKRVTERRLTLRFWGLRFNQSDYVF
jgi:hypothetical protein